AMLSAAPTAGGAPLDVVADAQSSHAGGAPIMSYRWEYGDSTAPTYGTSAAHRYLQPGGYRLSVTVTDAQGATDSASSQISVAAGEHLPPSAKIHATAVNGANR